MKILGVDPGTMVTGFGIIESRGSRYFPLEYGCIRTSAKASLPKRLARIHQSLTDILKNNRVDSVGVEKAFFAKNAHTALILGHARGVILLAAENAGLEIGEYSPREVKVSVTGNGAASKEQVEHMVQIMLGIREKIEPIDASDALAVALCHASRRKLPGAL